VILIWQISRVANNVEVLITRNVRWRVTLTLIQPASKWMHWAILRHHSDLFWAAISASSQVIPILDKSLLTVLLCFVCTWPEPLCMFSCLFSLIRIVFITYVCIFVIYIEFFPYYLFVSNSQVISCEDHLRNDLYCAGWGVGYSIQSNPVPLLNPGTSQCNACRGMSWWSIRITRPSQRSLLPLSMSSILCCPVHTGGGLIFLIACKVLNRSLVLEGDKIVCHKLLNKLKQLTNICDLFVS